MGVKYIVFYFFFILAFVIFAFIDTMLKSMKRQTGSKNNNRKHIK